MPSQAPTGWKAEPIDMEMKMITQDRLKELVIYNEKTGVFTWRISRGGCVEQGKTAGTNLNGYISITVDAGRYRAHRLAWLYVYGSFPAGEIDHINRDKADNRIENLRDVSHSENMQNVDITQARNSTGLLGVSHYKRTGKWQATFARNGKQKHLGYFNTPIDAHKAYLAAKNEIHIF